MDKRGTLTSWTATCSAGLASLAVTTRWPRGFWRRPIRKSRRLDEPRTTEAASRHSHVDVRHAWSRGRPDHLADQQRTTFGTSVRTLGGRSGRLRLAHGVRGGMLQVVCGADRVTALLEEVARMFDP